MATLACPRRRSRWWPRPLIPAALGGLAMLAAAACSSTPPPPPPKPPKVVLSPMPREVLGTGVSFTVEVTGCTGSITRVWITEHEEEVAAQDGGSTSNVLTADSTAFNYPALGIPASLPFFAHATCRWELDGGVVELTGHSEEQSVRFMPAREVLTGPWPFGDNYWVDQDAASFLTCSDQTATRVGRDKAVKGSVSLPFVCTGAAQLLFGADGSRYLMEPGAGLVRFSAGMEKLMERTGIDPQQMLMPDASGPLYVLGRNGSWMHLYALDPANGNHAWPSGGEDLPGTIGGRITLNRLGQIVYPYFAEDSTNMVTVGIKLYSVIDGREIPPGRVFGTIATDPLSYTPIPYISFDATAEIAYIAELRDPSRVWACHAVGTGTCTDLGGNRVWLSPALPGGVLGATRTADALVAWGERVAYFLDPATGAAITPVSEPIVPQGGLVFSGVVGGKDGTTWLFAQAKDTTTGALTWVIKEIIIFDQPNQRVADYMTFTDGFIVDIDKDGRAWLWKHDLASLLMASDYRQALNQ